MRTLNVAAIFISLFSVHPAAATLGVHARTVATEVRGNYTVHESQTGSGSVREYAAADGTVFGVAWSGLRHPNLSGLLGSAYHAEYRSAFDRSGGPNHRKGRRMHHAVRSAHVVVEKWGHMRNLGGHAYDPTLLPQDVTPDEIR
jgi:hypothetical protein